MAPRRRRRGIGKNNDGDDTVKNIVESLGADIQAIKEEIRLAKRKLEKVITDIQLRVVCYKSDMGPELLASNLYELMRRENPAVFVNSVDSYMDIVSIGLRHAGSNFNSAIGLGACERTIVDSNNSKTSISTMKSTASSNSSSSIERKLNQVHTNVEAKDDDSYTSKDSDNLVKEKKASDKNEAQFKNGSNRNEEMTRKEKKNIEMISERINNDFIQGKNNKQTTNINRKSTELPESLRDEVTNVQVVQEANKTSQACIEQNIRLDSSNGTNIVEKHYSSHKETWHEKYRNYNKTKQTPVDDTNEDFTENFRLSKQKSNEERSQVLNDRMNTQGEEKATRVMYKNIAHMDVKKNTNDKRTEKSLANSRENNMDLVTTVKGNDNSGKILKTPVVMKTLSSGLPRTVYRNKSSTHSNFSEAKKNTTEKSQNLSSNSKRGNILLASKLQTPNENFMRCSSSSENQAHVTCSGVLRNDQKNDIICASNTASMSCNKQGQTSQRSNSETRSSSRSKIPKFLHLSPLPKCNKAPIYPSSRYLGTTARPISCPNARPMLNKKPLDSFNYQPKANKQQILMKNSNRYDNLREFNKHMQAKVAQSRLKVRTAILKTSDHKYETETERGNNGNIVGCTGGKDNPKAEDLAQNEILSNTSLKPMEQNENIAVKQIVYLGDPVDKNELVVPESHIEPISSGAEEEDLNETLRYSVRPDHIKLRSSCAQAKNDPTQTVNSVPMTIPEDLYILRDTIPTKQNKSEKPVNFIRRNKERLKKIAPKNRRRNSKTKEKSGGIKIFKNSIVIDSRYLMIVNRILEDNRKCLKCKQDQGVWLAKDPKFHLGKFNQSSNACGDLSSFKQNNIYVKFSNVNRSQNMSSHHDAKACLKPNSMETTDYVDDSIEDNIEENILSHKVAKDKSPLRKSFNVSNNYFDSLTSKKHLDAENPSRQKIEKEPTAKHHHNENDPELPIQRKNQMIENKSDEFVRNQSVRNSEQDGLAQSGQIFLPEVHSDGKYTSQIGHETRSTNKAGDSVEFVETRAHKSDSRGSVEGNSLLSCLKTESEWRERDLKRSDGNSGLECLTASSNLSDKSNMGSEKSIKQDSCKTPSRSVLVKSNDLGKSAEDKPNTTIDLNDKSVEKYNSLRKLVLRKSLSKTTILSLNSIISSKTPNSIEVNATNSFLKSFENNSSNEMIAKWGQPKTISIQSGSIDEIAARAGDYIDIIDELKEKSANYNQQSSVFKVKPDIISENNRTIEIDIIKSDDLTPNRDSFHKLHDDNSRDTTSHQAVNKSGISHTLKSIDEILTIDSTGESVSNASKENTCKRYAPRSKSVEKIEKCNANTQRNTNCKSKNLARQQFSKDCDCRTNVRDKASQSSEHSDVNEYLEIIYSKLNSIKHEMDNLSHNIHTEIDDNDKDCNISKAYEKKAGKIDDLIPDYTQRVLQDIKGTEHNSLEDDFNDASHLNEALTSKHESSSVEYLDSKVTTNAANRINSDERPISIVPIQNLLASHYKAKLKANPAEDIFMNDIINFASQSYRIELEKEKEQEGNGRTMTTSGPSEFEQSMDNAFTSTKHDITSLISCTSSNRKTPFRNTPARLSKLTFKTPTTTSKTIPEKPKIAAKTTKVILKTPKKLNVKTPSAMKSLKVLPHEIQKNPKSATGPKTPKQITKCPNPPIASSTPLPHDRRGIHIKEEPE